MTIKKTISGAILVLAFIAAIAVAKESPVVAHAYNPPPSSFLLGVYRTMNLKIVLPPAEVLTPSELHIAGSDFRFVGGAFTPITQNGLTVKTALVDNRPRLQHYEITITGFTKGDGGLAMNNKSLKNVAGLLQNSLTAKAYGPPPAATSICILFDNCGMAPYQPYEYKLTFASRSKQNATDFGSYLKSIGNGVTASFLADSSCVRSTSGDHLCINTQVSFTAPGFSSSPQILQQAIPVARPGEVNVEGNVAGGGTVTGFGFDPQSTKAIAVGGTITGVSGGAGNNAVSYLGNATLLKWSTVGPQIINLINTNSGKATVASGTTFTGAMNLNSSTQTFTGNSTSFSTPPEGKLWKINGNATLNTPTFSGSGTIIVQGNLTVNGKVTCTPGTRLGIVAINGITFNSGVIDCGAYVAANGNIVFGTDLTDKNATYYANGIFVTGSNLTLPRLSNEVIFKVKYDSGFATNPTILFKDLLNIVFTTTS